MQVKYGLCCGGFSCIDQAILLLRVGEMSLAPACYCVCNCEVC